MVPNTLRVLMPPATFAHPLIKRLRRLCLCQIFSSHPSPIPRTYLGHPYKPEMRTTHLRLPPITPLKSSTMLTEAMSIKTPLGRAQFPSIGTQSLSDLIVAITLITC